MCYTNVFRLPYAILLNLYYKYLILYDMILRILILYLAYPTCSPVSSLVASSSYEVSEGFVLERNIENVKTHVGQ